MGVSKHTHHFPYPHSYLAMEIIAKTIIRIRGDKSTMTNKNLFIY
jgi:hypothetical protein